MNKNKKIDPAKARTLNLFNQSALSLLYWKLLPTTKLDSETKMDISEKIQNIGDDLADIFNKSDLRKLIFYLKENYCGHDFDVPPDENRGPKSFKVILKGYFPSKKIGVIKIVRSVTMLGLKEAKDLVEKAPSLPGISSVSNRKPQILCSNMYESDAKLLKRELEANGAMAVIE